MDRIEETVGDLLREAGYRLSVAESCTGGLLGHRLTNVSGSSDYFLGGVISYSNQAKVELLGVSEATLLAHGAVSRETVEEMAAGARDRFRTDIALAISGIAGPGGGTVEKPVGLVWIGLSAREGAQAWRFEFDGSREEVKTQAAEAALQKLRSYLIARSA
jgi:PncC family amidohydrolase